MSTIGQPDRLASRLTARRWARVEEMLNLPSVRLLGPVEVDIDGRAVELGHARQRAVLAALLLEDGRPVRLEKLVDRLWDEQPTGGVHATLRSYVSRLRKATGSGNAVRIARAPGAYVAYVEPDQLDLSRFRRLVVEARDLAERRQLGPALRSYEAALDLWHGDPLAGVDSEWLRGRRDALAAERHVVQLDHAEVALELGGQARVLPQLAALAGDAPYDERLAALLMLAQLRSGRQREALATYRQIRELLLDELGADPGPMLEAMHRRVLAGEEPPIGPDTVVSRPVPHQLPPGSPVFVGRTEELSALDDRLIPEQGDEAPRIVVAGGPGGCGKTWLATRWARRHADAFPDGQLFVDLRGFDGGEPVRPEAALHRLLLALGADPLAMPADLGSLTDLYRSFTNARRVLVVADNARSCEQVRPLIPSSAGSALLVTSRCQLPGLVTTDGARALSVGTLDPDTAVELLAAHVGRSRLDRESVAVDALVRHCAGLPLALGIVAGRASLAPGMPLATLAAQLDDVGVRLDGLGDPVAGVDLRASLACTLGSVRPPARELFALLGLISSPTFSVAAAASLVDVEPSDAAALLQELASAHLVELSNDGHFRVHDLVRLFAESLAFADPQADRAIDRILGYGVRVARAASRRPTPVDSAEWRRVADEEATLAALVDLALARGQERAVCDVVHALTCHYARAGRWQELIEPAVAAYDAAARLDDDRRLVIAAVDLGRSYIGLRDYAAAETCLVRGGAVAERLADDRLLADTHRARARLSARQSRPADAIRHDDRALALYVACGDRVGEATALNAIGWHLAHLGRPARALLTCRRALRIFEEQADLLGQALTLDSIGFALHRLGRYDDAAGHLERSIELAGSLGHHSFRAESLERLAAVEEAREA